MGLDIKSYHFSYNTLHRLRQFALDYEGINIPIMDFYDQTLVTTKKFKEFICHSDCEGIYISKSSKQYNKYKKKIKKTYGQLFCYFGDLDKLKKEVSELNDYILTKTQSSFYLNPAWTCFYNDVMSARKILKFC